MTVLFTECFLFKSPFSKVYEPLYTLFTEKKKRKGLINNQYGVLNKEIQNNP